MLPADRAAELDRRRTEVNARMAATLAQAAELDVECRALGTELANLDGELRAARRLRRGPTARAAILSAKDAHTAAVVRLNALKRRLRRVDEDKKAAVLEHQVIEHEHQAAEPG